MSLPSWLHSQINNRPPFEQVTGVYSLARRAATVRSWAPLTMCSPLGVQVATFHASTRSIPGKFTVIRGGSR